MTYAPKSTTVPELEISCSRDIAAAAVGLVSIKDEFDSLGRCAAGNAIVGQVFPDWRGYRSLGPHCFAAQVLPFYWYARSMGSPRAGSGRYKALVPTSAVIGDSWRWWPDNLDDAEQLRIVDKVFAAFEASTPAHAQTECAQYCHVLPLGIVLAHEGKNRVALFKARSLSHIPALVSDEDYPDPERLQIFELPNACLAVLDGRFVERVHAIHLVRELMETYGVSIERGWPSEFADHRQVIADLDDSSMRNSHEPYAVDMDKLKLDETCRETEVDATLLDIDAVRLPAMRTFLQAGAVLATLLVGMKLTATRWPELQIYIAFVAGALVMLMCVPILPIVRCKVRHLKDRERMNHFHQIQQRRARELRDTATQEV